MEKYHKPMGCFASILMSVPIGLLDSFVTMYGWNAFVVPTFNAPHLHLLPTWGLLVLFNYLIQKRSDYKDDSPTSWYELTVAVVSCLTSLMLMIIIHLFV